MSLGFLLKTFSEEDKPKKKEKRKELVSLSGILQRERLKLKKKKLPRPTSDYFNPSTITFGYCWRSKIAQLAGFYQGYRDLPTPKEELMLDLGNHIHDIMQNYFWKCNMLEGEFRCIKCEKTFWDRSPSQCPFVKSHSSRRYLEFREIPLKDDKYKISGRSDGFVWVELPDGTPEKQIMDIKSIANRMPNSSDRQFCFEDLEENGPKPDHVIQLMLYMMMSGVTRGHMIYVSKNSHQIKSFYIEYNKSFLEPYLNDIQEMLMWANDLKAGKRKDLPPPCEKAKCECEKIVIPAPK